MEVKEPLQGINKEIGKHPEDEEVKRSIEPEFLDEKLTEDIGDQNKLERK